ncbi:MAG: hypothetical protein ACT4OX_12205 [Actinomycetota bacterium]
MLTRRFVALLVVSALVLVGARCTVAAPEECAPVTATTAGASAHAAAQWLRHNQRADGSYVYVVDDTGADVGGYSIVRHAGVTLSLYQAARVLDEPAFATAADRAVEWMLDRLARRNDWIALQDGGVAALGGSALMLAALAERRLLTNSPVHDAAMRGLGDFLVSMQRDNGDFYVYYYLNRGEPDFDAISQYFAGEALWALARLHNALPDAAYRETAERAAHFIAVERDDTDFVPVPPLNDHWAAYGFSEMAQWPLGDDEARYARALFGRFHLLIRWEAMKQAGAVYEWAHGPKRRAAALGTWVEGQAALARLARTDERLDDVASDALANARCGADVLADRQRGADDPAVAGAWFTDGESRMDDQQHAISGLLALAELLDGATDG